MNTKLNKVSNYLAVLHRKCYRLNVLSMFDCTKEDINRCQLTYTTFSWKQQLFSQGYFVLSINSCHTRERCRFGRGCIYAHSQQELNEWKQEYERKLKEKAKEDIKKREELFSSEMASKFLKAPPEDVSLLFHVGVTGKIRQTDAKFYFFSYHNDNSDIEHLHVRRNDKKSNLNFEKIPHKWKANFTPKCTRGKIELKLIQLKILCFWNTHPIIVV